MLPLSEGLTHRCAAMWTGLGRAILIDAHEEYASFPAHPFQQTQERTPRGINTIFAKHSSIQSSRIEIFGKDSLCLIAEFMRLLEMKVFAGVGNVMMQSGYLEKALFPSWQNASVF